MLRRFSEMLDEIATDGITIDPEGGSEPNANLCMISLTRLQADDLNAADVVAFLDRAADCFDALRRTVSPDHSMVFYCWVDEMAGQLRFSVVSSLPLPFGCDVRIVRDPTAIARQLLACPYLDGIPFDELEPDDGNNTKPEPAVLDVCTIDLPRCDTIP